MSSHPASRLDHHPHNDGRVRWRAHDRPVGPILPWRVRCVETDSTIARVALRQQADLYAAARNAIEPDRYEVTAELRQVA